MSDECKDLVVNWCAKYREEVEAHRLTNILLNHYRAGFELAVEAYVDLKHRQHIYHEEAYDNFLGRER